MILQKSVHIAPNVVMPDLRNTLANVGANLLIECLKDLPKKLSNATPQPDKFITYGKNTNFNNNYFINIIKSIFSTKSKSFFSSNQLE